MNKLVVLVTFTFLLNGACGSPAERVVGGTTASPGQIPSAVALLRQVIGTTTYSFHCAGALIYPHIVLTASDCFGGMYTDPLSWQVRAGSVFHASGGVLVNVVGIRQNDRLAIANLGGPVTAINVAPVTLPPPSEETEETDTDNLPPSGGFGTIAGWGATSPTAPVTSISPTLQVANVLISDREVCQSLWNTVGFELEEDNFCTTGISSDAGICHNDLGSPLYHGQHLVGVASHYLGCGFDTFPAVYISVATQLQWINDSVFQP